MLGIIQNYNQYYTGSLWDLPIASLYCDTCQTIGIPIRDIILATKTQDSPEGFLQISKEVSRNGEFPSIGRIMSIDNTYQEVPENIIYHL